MFLFTSSKLVNLQIDVGKNLKSVLVYLAKKIAVGTRKDELTKPKLNLNRKKTKLIPEQPLQKIVHIAL